MMTLFHHEALSAVFLWQAGALVQDGWGAAGWLALTLGGVLLLGSTFRRPLRLLQAGDELARGQGVAVGFWRAAMAALAVGAAAMVAAQIGVLGFVGLLAPLLTRLAGASNSGLMRVAGIGAGLLALSDQMVQTLQPLIALHTGSFFALIGGFALVALLPRLKAAPEELREILPPASGLNPEPHRRVVGRSGGARPPAMKQAAVIALRTRQASAETARILSRLGPGESLLEIGCGWSAFAEAAGQGRWMTEIPFRPRRKATPTPASTAERRAASRIIATRREASTTSSRWR